MSRLTLADRLAGIAGLLAGLSAAAGLLVPGLYRDAPFWAQQARGTDVATLFLAVPILLIGLWAGARGSRVGRLCVAGGVLYLIYNYAIFSFSVALNPLLAVYIATLGLAVWSFALALERDAVPRAPVRGLPRRTAAGALIAISIVFGLLWLSQIAGATFTGEIPVDLERAELPTNPVYALDLALFLPLGAVAGIGLLRGARGAARFALPMLIWLFLTSVGIVGAFLFAAMGGDEFAVVPAVLVSVIGLITGALAALAIARGDPAGAGE